MCIGSNFLGSVLPESCSLVDRPRPIHQLVKLPSGQFGFWYSPPSIQSIWLKQTNATLEIGNLTGAQIYGWSCQTMQWRKAGLNLFCRIPRLHCWYLQVVLASSVSWAGGASDTVSHWSGTSWCILCWCKSCQLHGGTSCLPHIIITSGSAIGYSRIGH